MADYISEFSGNEVDELLTKINNLQIQTGKQSVTTVANSTTSITVDFPSSFSSVPIITLTPAIGSPGVDTRVSVNSITQTSFTLNVYRETAQTFNVNWIAIAM